MFPCDSVFYEYRLTPGDVASLTQPTPDLQRNYRQRGMLGSYGECTAGGRWRYSLRDLVGIWIADRLSGHGVLMDRRRALEIGYAMSPEIIAMVVGARRGWVLNGPDDSRFFAYVYTGESDRWSFHRLNSLADVGSLKGDRIEIFDLQHIAADVPEDIRSLLYAAAESELAGA